MPVAFACVRLVDYGTCQRRSEKKNGREKERETLLALRPQRHCPAARAGIESQPSHVSIDAEQKSRSSNLKLSDRGNTTHTRHRKHRESK